MATARARKGFYLNKGHHTRIHSLGLEGGRAAFFPSHHGCSQSRAGRGALTLATQVPLCLLPSLGLYPAQGGHHFLLILLPRRGAFFFFVAFPQAILSTPSLVSSAAIPSPVASAPPFRHRPTLPVLPRPGPPPQECLAPQATPLNPGIAGSSPEAAAREGRAVEGGGVSSSVLGVDWSGRGQWVGLLAGSRAPGSPPGIPRRSRSGPGDSDLRVATLVRASCLTSGHQQKPKPGGFPTPSRVSPVPLARPLGSPAAP